MFGFCLQFLNFQISKPKSYQLCEDAPSPMLLAKCFLPQEAFFSLSFSESATFSLPQPSSHCLLYLRLGTQTTGWVLFCLVLRWGGGIITFQIGSRGTWQQMFELLLFYSLLTKNLSVSLTHTLTHKHTAFFWLEHVWEELLLFEWQKRKIKVSECGWSGFKQAVPHSAWAGNHGEQEGAKI